VYGSYDNVNWEFVQNDKLYAVDSSSKLRIEFMRPEKYTYYRFKLANNQEKIIFDTAALIYNIETSYKIYFIERLTPKFSVESKDKKTSIIIEGLKNLRLCDITINTDSMFKRTVSTPQGVNKEIYNLLLNGTSYADTTIPLNWQISQEETYIITISDHDDRPIDIRDITVRYYADEVIFEGSANEAYTLEFGANSARTAPVYDIERYKDSKGCD
jgi:hypothetical protein